MNGSSGRRTQEKLEENRMAKTTLKAADIVEAIRTSEVSIADRVAIVRALRETTPGVVQADDHLLLRIRAAQTVSPEYVDTTVNALENSSFWQQSAATTPEDLRKHRVLANEDRPLEDEVQAYGDVLKHKKRYHHFAAVDKARAAYRVGKELKGEVGQAIRPHLSILEEVRRSSSRRRRKAEEPVPAATPVPKP
jgi:hypothetical protein